MTAEQEVLRDWHRLFGLLLTDFFTDSPFTVEIERDLSQQQQFLDVVILRRRRGRFDGRLPDGLNNLAAHNLISFKSHHEALDAWAIKELIGHYVAYRKLVSPSASESDLVPEDQFRLFAVCARFPHNLANQVPLQPRQAGVYECRWGTDVVSVTVAGELECEPHNAPLHLFSASAELVGFGRSAYRQKSARTSNLLLQLLQSYQGEGAFMSFTVEDFDRWFNVKQFQRLTPEQQRAVLEELPPDRRQVLLQSLPIQERLAGTTAEQRLASLSPEEIRRYLASLEQQTAERPAKPRKPPRKK
jgi:hypothetical protein